MSAVFQWFGVMPFLILIIFYADPPSLLLRFFHHFFPRSLAMRIYISHAGPDAASAPLMLLRHVLFLSVSPNIEQLSRQVRFSTSIQLYFFSCDFYTIVSLLFVLQVAVRIARRRDCKFDRQTVDWHMAKLYHRLGFHCPCLKQIVGLWTEASDFGTAEQSLV